MNFIYRIHAFHDRLPVYLFIPYMTVMSFVVVIPVGLIVVPLFGPLGAPYNDYSLPWKILILCILAPLFETALLQSAPIHTLMRYKGFPRAGIVIVSATAFGLVHGYNSPYIVLAFFIGLLLAYAYLMYLPKPQGAFFVVSTIHALRNAISILVELAMAGLS